MAWQDYARQNIQPYADQVIQALNSINPNYDWTPALQHYTEFSDANQPGWRDPSRGSPAGFASAVIQTAQAADPNFNAPQSAVQRIQQQQMQQQNAIQQEQGSHGGGGFLGLGNIGNLALAGGLGLTGFGLAGMGPMAGMFGAGEGLMAADMAGGMLPEFGTSSAYAAGLGTGASTPSWMLPTAGGVSDTGFGAGMPPASGGMMPPATPADPSQLADDWGMTQTSPGVWGQPPISDSSMGFGDWAKYGLSTGVNWLKDAFLGGGGMPGTPGMPGGGGGPSAGSMAPGLMALLYAGKQPGIDTSGLQGILGQLGGNHDAVVQAATDPFQKNIAAGYGDMVQSQGLRGIRGSSFGDTDLGNYIATTGRALSNAGANAAEGSLALQGNLAGNIAQLKAQSQQQKNSLYGRAFDVLGRGLNPKAYMGNVNLGTA